MLAVPLEVYGPSSNQPQFGFAHFIQKQRESYAWDTETRRGTANMLGAEVNVHEFDYSKVHVIYEKNGVKITSFPAVHIYDGPVSLRLEWNGLCFVIVTRMAVTSSHVWPNKELHGDFRKAPVGKPMQMSRWLADRQVFPKF